jgi:hypothetical protein
LVPRAVAKEGLVVDQERRVGLLDDERDERLPVAHYLVDVVPVEPAEPAHDLGVVDVQIGRHDDDTATRVRERRDVLDQLVVAVREGDTRGSALRLGCATKESLTAESH